MKKLIDIISRIKLAYQILKSGTTLHIKGDFNIIVDGNIKLSSEKHLIFESGLVAEPDRKGYNYSVWVNPPYDNLGRPKLSDVGVEFEKNNKRIAAGLKNIQDHFDHGAELRPLPDYSDNIPEDIKD